MLYEVITRTPRGTLLLVVVWMMGLMLAPPSAAPVASPPATPTAAGLDDVHCADAETSRAVPSVRRSKARTGSRATAVPLAMDTVTETAEAGPIAPATDGMPRGPRNNFV